MAAPWHDSSERPAGSPLSGDVAARVEAIVHAAEREAMAVERAIAERRRSAEEEVRRYLAAARLQVDAEAAARAARLESFSSAARRLADELSDAANALTHELRDRDHEIAAALPPMPWPETPPAPPAPEPSWTRETPPAPAAHEAAAPDPVIPDIPEPASTPEPPAHEAPLAADPHVDLETPVPSAARLVAIEMAVGGSSRAEVERHLRDELGVAEPSELLDDVFGAASHAGSTLAWGES
jgi:hypothetical protein